MIIFIFEFMFCTKWLFIQIIPNIIGQKINEYFDIVRPLIEFSFDTVLARSNNIFEVMTVEAIDVLLKVRARLTVQYLLLLFINFCLDKFSMV